MPDFEAALIPIIIQALAISTLVQACVAALKLARPLIASGLLIVAALLCGQLIAVLVTLALGTFTVFSTQAAALTVLIGIIASLNAMGLYTYNKSADVNRIDAKQNAEYQAQQAQLDTYAAAPPNYERT